MNRFPGEFTSGEKKADTFGKWKVLLSGNMFCDNGRHIAANQLAEDDWFLQFIGKNG